MPKLQDQGHDVESGGASSEATPLLGAAGVVVPPPAAAPPPPPMSDVTPEGENMIDISSYQKKNETPLLSSANTDDNASRTQQSTKSGKSGKSRKSKKKNADAASTRSGKSTNKAKKKKKEGPQKSVIHHMFDAVRLLAIIASCFMFMMQVIPLIALKKESTWLQIAVRSYLAIFCFSFILTESRIPLLQKIGIDNWILRGFIYSFIGLIGMEQDLAVKVEDIVAGTASVLGPDFGTLFATLFMSITTWLMIGVGVLYTVLGVLCMQGWYERLDKEYREKMKEWKQKKKRDEDFEKQKKDYRQYETDRNEGRGEWYDDM